MGTSMALNAGLVMTLAELDAPDETEDAHEAHRIRPSVVPPPEREAELAPTPPSSSAVAALPEAPPLPSIELPGPTLSGEGPQLAWSRADDFGLSDLEALGALGRPRNSMQRSAPDRPPQLSVPPDLARFYPRSAQRRGLGGRTLLALEVGADGRVIAIEVLLSEPPGVFDEAAKRAATSLVFEPAEVGGKPVSGETRLDLHWKPQRSS